MFQFNNPFAAIKNRLSHLMDPIEPIEESKVSWKTLPIQECGEPLVPVGPFSHYNMIFTDPIYYGGTSSSPYQSGELPGALITPFMRQGVAEALEKASKLLPEGHAFLVWDAYRPLSVQKGLFNDFYNQHIARGVDAEEASAKAQKLVSIPSPDPTRPSPHNTGGSVDLTIVKFTREAWAEMKKLGTLIAEADKKGDWQTIYKAEMRRLELLHQGSTPLNMGTAFDQNSDATKTRFYEEKQATASLTAEEKEIRNNRRLLVNVLKSAGLGHYPDEWWHFDKGNQFHAGRGGPSAIYGAASFSESGELEANNKAWEEMRAGHYARNVAWQQGHPLAIATKRGADPRAAFAHEIALRTSDLREAPGFGLAAPLTL